jgi:hypothetical protein
MYERISLYNDGEVIHPEALVGKEICFLPIHIEGTKLSVMYRKINNKPIVVQLITNMFLLPILSIIVMIETNVTDYEHQKQM